MAVLHTGLGEIILMSQYFLKVYLTTGKNDSTLRKEVRGSRGASHCSGHSSLIASIWPDKYPSLPPADRIRPFLPDGESPVRSSSARLEWVNSEWMIACCREFHWTEWWKMCVLNGFVLIPSISEKATASLSWCTEQRVDLRTKRSEIRGGRKAARAKCRGSGATLGQDCYSRYKACDITVTANLRVYTRGVTCPRFTDSRGLHSVLFVSHPWKSCVSHGVWCWCVLCVVPSTSILHCLHP